AWAHMLDTPTASVPIEEHNAVVERVRMLEQELEREKQQREEETQNFYRAIQGVYSNMALLSNQTMTRMLSMDDKIEGVLDQTHACNGGLKNLEKKMEDVDDATMDLETRIDRLESPQQPSKSRSPVSEAISILAKSPILPPRIDLNEDSSWTVNVMLMPQSSGEPFVPGSVGHRRCLSRNLLRALQLPDSSSSAFVSAVDEEFLRLLRNRSWMPLVVYRSGSTQNEPRYSLRGLPADKCSPDLWDRNFLQEYCLHREMELGDMIYLSLSSGELSWQEIKKFPRAHGFDRSCWEHVGELDSPRTSVVHERDDFGLNVDDGYDLPPYSSRAPSEAGQVPMPTLQYGPTSRQHETTNQRDFEASEDEHALKRICLRPKPEKPFISGETLPQTQKQYISGRTKRKISVREKQNVSGNRLSDWKNPVQTLLHCHTGKDKDVGNNA
ncbi:MAG: hypothetical protein Q9157_008553, partial [Trypethelium eluteriae]